MAEAGGPRFEVAELTGGPLADVYPDSRHVRDVGLSRADDEDVWTYARTNGFTIVSKDSDLYPRSFLYGAPPKVIWIRLGNCSTDAIEKLLRRHAADMGAFEADRDAAFLILA